MTATRPETSSETPPAAPPEAPPPVAAAPPSRAPSVRPTDVVLRNGSTVHVRPMTPAEEPALLAFYEGLTEDSLTLRFFSGAVDLSKIVHVLSDVDGVTRAGLIATTGTDDRVVAHVTYAQIVDERAEVSLAVAERFQGQGLGTLLLGQLAELASANGIRVFEAEVLPINHRMVEVFRGSGFAVEVKPLAGELHVRFPTSLTAAGIEQFERREQIAATSALTTVLAPRSIAVIGASRRRGTPGGEVFHNLLASEFNGPVYPVNPAAPVVQSVVAYPTVEAVPGPVDLAIVAVPAACVVEVAEACARKGVRSLVVISAGFAEIGPAGQARQAELLRVCRASGMRLIGPNCIGVVNTSPDVRLNATFGPIQPGQGRIGLASQSGALGLAAIDEANAMGLGLSSFVSMGNKADISGNDVLQFWESDPATDVLLLYLESFGNPRKFGRIARRVGRTKPIVVVKSGRSTAGARASASHTGALLASSDVTVDALFRQAGVIRADTLEQLFDVASLLVSQPVPPGRRVGIVTNVGGPGILCADTCEAEGLRVPELTPETQERLRGLLAAEASVTNPVDMIATATPAQYRAAIEAVAADPNVDAVVAIFIPPLAIRPADVARAVAEATGALGGQVPVLSVFMGSSGAPCELTSERQRIPCFRFPESAAIALARAARYGEWRQRPVAVQPPLADVRRDEAKAVVATALARGGGWLTADEVARLLDCYGLPRIEQHVAATPDEAAALAGELGGSLALKGIAPGLLHKSDVGAVVLGLVGAEAVREAARSMAERLGRAGSPPTGFLLQRMAGDGTELLVGVVQDRLFGPVVACGAGGTVVELLKDVSVRLAPLSTLDADEMLAELRTFPLLTGYRGRPSRDLAAMRDVLIRVSALAEDVPEVAELDCNPVLALERGACILDARIRVEPAEPPLPLGGRR